MQRRNKNSYNRLVAIIISFTLAVCTICIHWIPICADEGNPTKKAFALKSNSTKANTVDLYQYGSTYFILLDDLCTLTRSQNYVDPFGNASVRQGYWTVNFDYNSQIFDDGYQKIPETILAVGDGLYAIPALKYLVYFKAAAWFDGDTLNCIMPELTEWEALYVDYNDSLIDVNKLYGGESNVDLQIFLDLLNEFILGEMPSMNGLMGDVYLSALKVDIQDNAAVKKSREESNNKLYEFLHGNDEDSFSTLKDILGITEEPSQWVIQHYFNVIEKSFVEQAKIAFEAGRHVDVEKYGAKLYETFKAEQAVSESVENFFNHMDMANVILFASAAISVAEQVHYADATNNLVYEVLGSENLNRIGVYDIDDDWTTVADSYRNIFGITKEQLKSEGIKVYTDKLFWEAAVGTGVTAIADINMGVWKLCLNLSRLLVKAVPQLGVAASLKASQAEQRAMMLSDLQKNVYKVIGKISDMLDGQPDAEYLYARLIKAEQLFCRVSIAMYQNFIEMINNDEFAKNKDHWRNLFQGKIDKLAVSLYKLTSLQEDASYQCIPIDLSTFVEPTISNSQETATALEEALSHVDYYDLNGSLKYYEVVAYYDNGQICSKTLYSVEDAGSYTYSVAKYTLLYIYDGTGKLTETVVGSFGFEEDYDKATGAVNIGYTVDANGNRWDSKKSSGLIHQKQKKLLVVRPLSRHIPMAGRRHIFRMRLEKRGEALMNTSYSS